MKIKELVVKNRSYRRFYQQETVDRGTLMELVDLARLSASGANMQPLKFILCHETVLNARVFAHLKWAAYLQDWEGPKEGERPSAYIVILGDRGIAENYNCDHGIAAQSIMLGAVERGLGGCIIASIGKAGLRQELSLPERYEILLVLALGRPKETVIVEPVGPEGDIKYWRDSEGGHHVPKRSLEELILEIR
jgi:nitroreductase